ncbi:hypothetical protein CN643_16250 [Parageobacillus yumthangensis]|nr:hypothetical protein CN643_16250 [Parageobacillus yumthangensis]TXK90704.1 hypothetical protein FVE24_10140 [Parageobacillus sp. SY1]
MNENYVFQVEKEMSLHPLYCKYTFINDLVFHTYTFITELLAEENSDFRRLYDRFQKSERTITHRVIQDPVMRDVLNKAFGLLKKGKTEKIRLYNKILDYTISILDEGKQIGPLKSRMEKIIYLGSTDSSPWIWFINESNNDIIEKHFKTLFQNELAAGTDPEPILVMPDEKTQKTLQYSFELLTLLLPDLSKNVLPHVQMIAIVDTLGNRENLFESASTNDIPSTIFLSRLVVDNPIKTAEAILHESLHKKYADLLLIKPILRPGYSAQTSRPIYITWRDTYWPVDRVLAAFHVYTYLG